MVFSDSISALQNLSVIKFDPGIISPILDIKSKFVKVQKRLDHRIRAGLVKIYRISSHSGIQGDEEADFLVVAAAYSISVVSFDYSFRDLSFSIVNKRFKKKNRFLSHLFLP